MIDEAIIGIFVAIFCRVGCCLMLLPGIASMRISTTIRLFIALGLCLTLVPLLGDAVISRNSVSTGFEFLVALARECMTGFAIGLVGRVMFASIHMTGNLIMQVSGYGHPFAIDDGHGEPNSELSAFLSTAVVVLLFILDFHHIVMGAVIDSYNLVPFGSIVEPALELERLGNALVLSCRLSLAVSGPFIVASVLINLAFGILNRMTPQLPVYFISSSFLIGFALWLFAKQASEAARILLAAILDVLR